MGYDLLTVTSVVKMIPIGEVKSRNQTILDSSFHPAERQELSNRHIRSTAGVLALKEALSTLFYQITGYQTNIRDFRISRLETGAPVLISLPEHLDNSSFRKQNLFISISHSRQNAYGLAVYQEERDEE